MVEFWRDQQNQKDLAKIEKKKAEKDYLINVIKASEDASASIDIFKGELKRKRDLQNRDFLL